MRMEKAGISGFASYLPPHRVDLRQWCEWTDNCWDKVGKVVGTGFRIPGPDQSMYTMAATAVLRLIDQYDVDPGKVRFLGLGTESSTDNSAGAIIIKGMLNEALRQRGRPLLSRHCEVPEIKHACLGGIYAMKSGLRFLLTEPEDSVAIVVSSDIAKYEIGSSGEATQGAGAVAMLLEKNPALLEVDLAGCGSASDYRAVDFRKPMTRGSIGQPADQLPFHDTPIYNGKYSTSCYLDETACALKEMLRKLNREPADYYHSLKAVFMHRPYERMPVSSFGFGYLHGLANNGAAGRAELSEYCDSAELCADMVIEELQSAPDLLAFAMQRELGRIPYPESMRLLRNFREQYHFKNLIRDRMTLGSRQMRELGNVYSASLPAWIAAGLEEALQTGSDLGGQEVLAVGYGSGDAAEAIPMRVVDHWEEAAGRISFAAALTPVSDLSYEQYLSLHGKGVLLASCSDKKNLTTGEFFIDRIGDSVHPEYADQGVEYYRYVDQP